MKLSIKNWSRRSSRENVKVELNGEMSFSVHLIFMALCHIDAQKSPGYFPTFVVESRDNKRETIVSDYVDGQISLA